MNFLFIFPGGVSGTEFLIIFLAIFLLFGKKWLPRLWRSYRKVRKYFQSFKLPDKL